MAAGCSKDEMLILQMYIILSFTYPTVVPLHLNKKQENKQKHTFHSSATARANRNSPAMTLPAMTPTGTSAVSPGLLTLNPS